jgi:hypothetical protein
LVPSSPFGRSSRRVSRRTVSQSRKSIEGWYGTPAHGANPRFRAPQSQLGEHVVAATDGRLRHLLEHVPVLDDLPVVVEAEDVDAGHVPGLVVEVDGDEIAFGDHPVDLDVERPDGGEELLDGLQPVAGLGVVLEVVLDDQVVEGVGVAGSKRVKQPSHRLLVPLCLCHDFLHPSYQK